jgi:hypothetical protein
MSLTQATFSGMEEYKRREPTLGELYQLAVQNNAGIEVLST